MVKWGEREINYLKENYSRLGKEKMMSDLNRSWSSITNKCHQLQLKFDTNLSNPLKLVDGSNESFYWLGFIMADGHFGGEGRVQVNLGDKDLNHLRRLAHFMEFQKELNKPRYSFTYKIIEDYLIENYDIKCDKTYHPCKINSLSGDSFFSFIVGFIDGDGTIDKNGGLRIKCHSSWLDNIDKMLEFISEGDYYSCKINSEGLSFGCMSGIETMKRIKKRIIALNLPILNRKWDRVDMGRLSKREITQLHDEKCFILFNKGLSKSDVVRLGEFSSSFVYGSYKRWENN